MSPRHAVVTDKKASVAMLSLVGDHRDDFGGGGWSTYSLTWTTGSLDLQSAAALEHGRGDCTKQRALRQAGSQCHAVCRA